jgi:hypothetical protein
MQPAEIATWGLQVPPKWLEALMFLDQVWQSKTSGAVDGVDSYCARTELRVW